MKQVFKEVGSLAFGLTVVLVVLVVPTCIGSIVIHPPMFRLMIELEIARFAVGLVSVFAAAGILRLAWGIGADFIK